ncbi:hypothetical protein PLICRDRAFT_98080 [Plicaturopsis crispa FD-325 SS-3]|nr:hypothetical protein PLICRDRAFT_98080 [Plicaturopsis crispa FD-325 SS-3]
MSATSSPADSPVSAAVQPLHNPSQAAHIVVPQAPLGNATLNGTANSQQAPGMGVKALLAKKMAKNINPTFISPTDNLMTPCTQKISAAKKKHFTKGAKPMGSLFGQPENSDEHDEDSDAEPQARAQAAAAKMDTEENPF